MKKGLISFVLVLTAVNNKFDKLIANFLGNYLYLTLYCPINVQNLPPNPAEKVGRSAPQRSSVCEQSEIVLDIYPNLRLICLTEYCWLLR